MGRIVRERSSVPAGSRRRSGLVPSILLAAALAALVAWDFANVSGTAQEIIATVGLSAMAVALIAGIVGALLGRRVHGVDERSRTARRLRLSEACHDSFWKHTPDGLFTVEVLPDGGFVFSGTNPAHQRLTGLPEARLAGRTPAECLPPQIAAAVTAKYRECVDLGGPITYEELLDLPGGRRHWRTNLVPVRDPVAGRIVLIFGSARDITADREAMAEAERLNGKLGSILSSVSDCYCALDRHLRLTHANRAVLEWAGRTEAEVIGKSYRDHFTPETEMGRLVIRAVQSRTMLRGEAQSIAQPDRWLDCSVYPAPDGGVALFFRDVTELRAAREAQRRISEQILASQEGERRRIASELHDSTAQHIVAASLALMRLPATADDRERQVRDDVDASLREALQELRVFTYLLHPPCLHRNGLVATLTAFLDGFGRRTGLATSLRASPALDGLPEELQRTVFRVIQEALSNTHRHARAGRVDVRARLVRETLFARVCDDGRGMPLANGGRVALEEVPAGVGLPGMRARLRQFGGDLRLRSGVGGTVLTAMVPVTRAHRAT